MKGMGEIEKGKVGEMEETGEVRGCEGIRSTEIQGKWGGSMGSEEKGSMRIERELEWQSRRFVGKQGK